MQRFLIIEKNKFSIFLLCKKNASRISRSTKTAQVEMYKEEKEKLQQVI